MTNEQKKQKKVKVNFFNKWFYKLKLKMVKSAMSDIESLMVEQRYNRTDRRIFWRAMVQNDKKQVFSILEQVYKHEVK